MIRLPLSSIVRALGQPFVDLRDVVLRDLRRVVGREPWIRRDLRTRRLRLGSGDGTSTVVPQAIRMPGTNAAVALTRDSLERLRRSGFRVFDVSPRGIEIGFLGPQAVFA